METQNKTHLIVDTNLFLRQINIPEMLGFKDLQSFQDQYEVHTLEEVISEIRDASARQFISNSINYKLTVHSSQNKLSAESQRIVGNFSKDTGDFKSLSAVDMQVIGLGVEIARELG